MLALLNSCIQPLGTSILPHLIWQKMDSSFVGCQMVFTFNLIYNIAIWHQYKQNAISQLDTMDGNNSHSHCKKAATEQYFQKFPSKEFLGSEGSNASRLIKGDGKNQDTFLESFQKMGLSLDDSISQFKEATSSRLMELEGQCKIKSWQYIKINAIQAIFAIFLTIISVIGLFALKYSPWYRKVAFFCPTTPAEATHLYITGNDKKNDIVKIINSKTFPIYFLYKKLKYTISTANKHQPTPTAYQFEKQFELCFSYDRLKKGLSSPQVLKRRQLYGPNQHLVETPSYFEYLLDVMTQPFFLLQYFFCVMFFVEGYAPFSIALLSFSFLTTTINYILLWYSYKKTKEIAQKQTRVKVVRDGTETTIDCRELVPGDVFVPQQQTDVPADCIVGFGDIYVNEANLTGQSFPIGKFKISEPCELQNSNIWIYQGSKILQTKVGNTFAIIINTGFTTHRGRIIRKIMNRTVKDPDIIRSTLIFVLEVVIVSVITFFATLFLLVRQEGDRIFIFFKFLQFLTSSAPPPLPIFFNLAYSLSLFRLGFRGIGGTQPQKTVDGAQIKTFCFDKTGTLTRNDISISKIFRINKEKKLSLHNVISELGEKQNSILWYLFATCHTTKLIKNQLLGDEIDKQMFTFINAKMENTTDPNIRFVIKSTKDFGKKDMGDELELGKEQEDLLEIQRKRASLIQMKEQNYLEVLRINQFQSKFQSMSVLVRDKIKGKYYIFVKGSPEKILHNSCNIQQQSQDSQIYMSMVKTLSLNGLRTIAIGYKQLKTQTQVDEYLKADREQYLANVINLGLIAFENRLKVDTWLTLHRLIKSNIEPKMITGDNIYIAVETARRAGILGINEKVVILEGERNIRNSVTVKEGKGKFTRIFQGLVIQKLSQNINEDSVQNFKEHLIQVDEKADYLKGKYIFAVDNAFLTMNPAPLLSHNIKVFARIPPQNKAFIIKQYKKQHNQYIKTHYSKFTQWLRTKKWKIGMCGDGANDLLALRQADLSIGIQQTDASYGSSFTVRNMLDVDWVIKQSKCTQANIIVLYQYYGSIAMFVVITSIILVTDATYFSTQQLMFLNFGTILIITGTIAMSRPYGEQSQYVPEANMMSLHNHLVFWGNLIIPFAGILGSWFYYYSTPDFKPNPKREVRISTGGFNPKNHSTTLIFILVIITISANAFITYRSRPWRERFWTNYLFTLTVFGNFIIAIIFAFTTKQLQQAFQFQPINIREMAVCVGITLSALIINLFYNIIVGFFHLDHKKIILEKEQAKLESILVNPGKVRVTQPLITS